MFRYDVMGLGHRVCMFRCDVMGLGHHSTGVCMFRYDVMSLGFQLTYNVAKITYMYNHVLKFFSCTC